MKTFAFFSPKGGVGKTSQTEMFASFLAYDKLKRVCIIDSDTGGYSVLDYRKKELELRKDPKSPLARFMERNQQPVAYDIFEFPIDMKNLNDSIIDKYLDEVCVFLNDHENDYDYALFNFPGRFDKLSPSFGCIMCGLVDLTAVPMEKDTSSRMQAYLVTINADHYGKKAFVYWNRLSRKDLNRVWYLDACEKIFRDHGLEVHPFRVKAFAKVSSDSDTKLFVKSTMCWPDRYVDMACPGLKGFYEDLKQRLDSV